jgi:hypothetical protein
MCPRTWQAQYKLKADTLPQCVHDLEKIKKAFPMEQEQPGKKGEANPGNSNKQKMVSFHKPIPKKPCKDTKHCSLCKKALGHARNSQHVRLSLKMGFSMRKGGSTASDKKTASAFMQLSAKFAKLEKANEKF